MLTPLDQPRHRGTTLTIMGVLVLVLGLTFTPAGPAVAEQMKPLLTEIVNTPDKPVPVRDVDANGRHAVAANASVTTNAGPKTILTVPAGKRLVIETVTVLAALPDGLKPRGLLRVVTDGTNVLHTIALRPGGSGDGSVIYDSTHAIRLYADPGTDVSFEYQYFPQPGPNFAAAVSLSGYYVNV
ncbi:MAG: hypothetical protein ACRDT4_13500 [Micromonosporaceae bacterium]